MPFHYDHLHIDLARHDPRGQRRICKPILKFAPRIDPEQSRQAYQAAAPSADLAPIDREEDGPEEGYPATSHAPAAAPAAPMPPAASRPAPSVGFTADLPAPSAGYGRAPAVRAPAQTYAPPGYGRPAAGQPLALTGSGIY